MAMLLGLFILFGIIQVFTGSRATYRLTDAQTRVQETGRYATIILARELRMARSMGCRSLGLDQYEGTLNVRACSLMTGTGCSGGNSILTERPLGISGPPAANWLADLPGTNSTGARGAVKKRHVRGDVLVTWGVVGDGLNTQSNMLTAARTEPIKVLANLADVRAAGFPLNKAGLLALISDCDRTDVFAISEKIDATTAAAGANEAETAAAAAAAAADAAGITSLKHEAGAVNKDGTLSWAYNWPGDEMATGRTYRARVFPFDYKVFFICCVDQATGLAEDTAGGVANCASTDANISKQFRPSLCRYSASDNETESLVLDIADLRATYDGWQDGAMRAGLEGSPEVTNPHVRLSSLTAVPDAGWINDASRRYWDRVDTIRIQLLAASAEEIPTPQPRPYTSSTDTQVLGQGIPADRRLYQDFGFVIADRALSTWSSRE
ncbi:MAG TPA: hypothetical protein VES73_07120 [Lamprocystis sp. (in: g-proteobacteria)]|nr:hypothetical protein [Lamprocystis sp. (in: g-proteobacteria)]